MIISKNQNGFTLVELAIVMIIIGLLIGGVLKGQELIENAKVSSTISELKGVQAAFHSFQDTYSGMPGDINVARSRVKGCGEDANSCLDGDGNGLLSFNVNNPSAMVGFNVAAFAQVTGSEPAQAWKHLALADLITGVDPSVDATVDGADEAWGATHPASALGGGMEIFTVGSGSNLDNRKSGLIIRISNSGLAQNGFNGIGTLSFQGREVASSIQALNMDKKLDDGLPRSGVVQGMPSNPNPEIGCFNGSGTGSGSPDDPYWNSSKKNCVLFYYID